ncbi:hypothetical protein THC_0675 [Caldimicrobium thiodismutans]|uniref:ParB-like N-terminal domain-containing protein n=1 Tax=Caldimicrobium thiodismutans TaxID=1653476 RepID=A0A0U4W1V0_9BACT|nr:ParB N-terminal domain-containing protein [Caldimicrobium thiodismutans]BAU23067.1 hypothetical protein THC_0675 [Caldimicrobium thiodismutans]
MLLKEIQIAEIDLTDKSFLFSYPERTPLLIESIKTIGVIEPPLLYPGNKGYQIICGEGRIKALKALGVEKFLACVINEEKQPWELLYISLESNLFRGLNLVEKALFLERAEKIFPKEKIIEEILPKLDFTKHLSWYFFLKKVLALGPPYRELLIKERLNPKTIEIITDLNQNEKEEYYQLLISLHLTHSEQMETLEVLRDLQKREQRQGLLPEQIKNLLTIEDPNQRKKAFKETLQAIKYPNFLVKRTLMEDIKRDLQKKGLQIEFSPYLENKRININFDLKDIETLKKNLKTLERYGEKILSLFE